MLKIGRNDLCYCGSGKKYKKCCLSQVSKTSQLQLEDEVVDIQSDVFRFAFSNNQFKQIVQENFNKYSPQKDMEETFYFFVALWTLMTCKIFDGSTALKTYMNTSRKHVSPKINEIIDSWVEHSPSMVRVDEIKDRKLWVRDIFTNQSKEIKLIDKLTETPTEGSLAFGFIVPFVDDISIFFTSALTFEDNLANDIERIVHNKFKQSHREFGYSNHSLFLQEEYLNLLDIFMSDELLQSPPQESKEEDLDEQSSDVESLFLEKLKDDDASAEVMEAGSFLWYQYCLKKKPVIKNKKIYAAALHYILLDKALNENRLTQKEAAALYHASVGSVSSRSREMATVLEKELKEYKF
ncbi:YecA family protein [Bacillus sp. Marseille-P3661]|uniref:YecA family protein n=1 Tax=Bacillus sp. Marseille-P3661 TaxID=1936234 RepID=UPI000C815D70|nr:SEC-C domain-containing protein [Bacillus sp. Marseille-P3661]